MAGRKFDLDYRSALVDSVAFAQRLKTLGNLPADLFTLFEKPN
jgi:hypothetical protein